MTFRQSTNTRSGTRNKQRRDVTFGVSLVVAILIHGVVIGAVAWQWSKRGLPTVQLHGGGDAWQENQNTSIKSLEPQLPFVDSPLSVFHQAVSPSASDGIQSSQGEINPRAPAAEVAIGEASSTIAFGVIDQNAAIPKTAARPLNLEHRFNHSRNSNGLGNPDSTNPQPVYPPEELRSRIKGTVILRVKIEPSGRVIQASVIESSGRASFDDSALRAVRQWRFNRSNNTGGGMIEAELPIQFVLRQ